MKKTEVNNRTTGHRRIVKRIIKKKTLENPKTGESVPIEHKRHVSPDFKEKTKYEVITTKYDRDGSQSMQRIERFNNQPPRAFRDISNSMRVIDQIKNDPYSVKQPTEQLLQNARDKLNDNGAGMDTGESGAGFLCKILNPRNVMSMQTIKVDNTESNLYIQTVKQLEDPYDVSSRRQKITIIKKKRRRDGSIESQKQMIYKDYSDKFA